MFTEIVTAPTSPPVPEIALPSPQSVYHTPYTTITELSPRLSSDTYASPSGSYLPVPSSYNSPFVQASSMGSSTRTYSSFGGDPYSPSYQTLYPGSPASMASPASFYSLNSPAMASTSSFHSVPTTASPRAVPFPPPANWEASAFVQQAPTPNRIRVPQTVKLSPKRNRSHKVSFFTDGTPGVLVAGVLKGDVVLDGHDERVLERTGHRQIRITIQVSRRTVLRDVTSCELSVSALLSCSGPGIQRSCPKIDILLSRTRTHAHISLGGSSRSKSASMSQNM